MGVLRDRMIREMQLRCFAASTQKSYLDAVTGLAKYYIAISNHRLHSVADGQVVFAYRDRKDANLVKHLTLPAAEFIRRFLQHVVPPGFCRIRHFRFLANRVKPQRLQRCRELLGVAPPSVPAWPHTVTEQVLLLTGIDVTQCPRCGERSMVAVAGLVPERPAEPAAGHDSS